MKVVMFFLHAGVPVSKIDCFHELLEETGYRLTDRRHMFDYIPFIQTEVEHMKREIQGLHVSMIFDGSTHANKDLAIVVRFIDVDWNVQQRLVRVQLLAKSLCGEEIAREVISVLPVTYSIMSDRLCSNEV